MTEFVMIVTLISIWSSLLMSSITLGGAVHFWLEHSRKIVDIVPLKRYPLITIVVPAHNEAVVIAQTTQAILELNYPADKVELLIFADNCNDQTAQRARTVLQLPKYEKRKAKVIERHGSGGKAGVLNDALKMAHGEYIGVYDADAMPEKRPLFLSTKNSRKSNTVRCSIWPE